MRRPKRKIQYCVWENRTSQNRFFYFRALKRCGKSGDGLNVQCGIIDEYHAHPTSEIYDVLVSGSGARPNPLMMIITTAGFNLSHPCYRVEYQYVSKILNLILILKTKNTLS